MTFCYYQTLKGLYECHLFKGLITGILEFKVLLDITPNPVLVPNILRKLGPKKFIFF